MHGKEFLWGSTLYDFMVSSPRHAGAFVSGFMRVAPGRFSEAKDPIYNRILQAAKGDESPSDEEVLGDRLLARSFSHGCSLGHSVLGKARRDVEIVWRALLADCDDKSVFHLFRDSGGLCVGNHMPDAPCDYCAAGAPNHAGDPRAVPIQWEESKSFSALRPKASDETTGKERT